MFRGDSLVLSNLLLPDTLGKLTFICIHLWTHQESKFLKWNIWFKGNVYFSFCQLWQNTWQCPSPHYKLTLEERKLVDESRALSREDRLDLIMFLALFLWVLGHTLNIRIFVENMKKLNDIIIILKDQHLSHCGYDCSITVSGSICTSSWTGTLSPRSPGCEESAWLPWPHFLTWNVLANVTPCLTSQSQQGAFYS